MNCQGFQNAVNTVGDFQSFLRDNRGSCGRVSRLGVRWLVRTRGLSFPYNVHNRPKDCNIYVQRLTSLHVNSTRDNLLTLGLTSSMMHPIFL